jgi:hypothetical protein
VISYRWQLCHCTVSNGFYFDPEGKVKYHISQNKGVTMVLSLFEDADKNLLDWIMGLTALIFSLPLKKVCRRYRKVRDSVYF